MTSPGASTPVRLFRLVGSLFRLGGALLWLAGPCCDRGSPCCGRGGPCWGSRGPSCSHGGPCCGSRGPRWGSLGSRSTPGGPHRWGPPIKSRTSFPYASTPLLSAHAHVIVQKNKEVRCPKYIFGLGPSSVVSLR